MVALALRQLLPCCGNIRASRSLPRYRMPHGMSFTIFKLMVDALLSRVRH